MTHSMKFLIIGTGSIGTRHKNNLEELGHGVVTCDPDKEEADYHDVYDALTEDLDAAVICTPPPIHIEMANRCLDEGLHVIVEKPLSTSLNGVDDLVSKAMEKNLTLVTCCNLRFEPALQTLVKPLIDGGEIGDVVNIICEFGHYLPLDYPDYRARYVSGAGGGVILNAAIHEIDLLQSWFGSIERVDCTAKRSGVLDITEEDIADISLEFENGIHASIHADYLQRKYHRTIKFIGTENAILWDFGNMEVKITSEYEEVWRVFKIPEVARDDMYIREMEYFIALIKGEVEPMPYINGVEALRTALKCTETIE